MGASLLWGQVILLACVVKQCSYQETKLKYLLKLMDA
jgi:hypothetical protein